jgi:hypothetical protein
MAATFLELTNEVLRAYNEVELTSSNFGTSRGVHSWAKDGVNMAIRQINTKNYKWPWMAIEHTQVLTPGTFEYAWPTTFRAADWNSFQIQRDDALEVMSKTLRVMDRDEWYTKYRDRDTDGIDDDGISVPEFVFNTHGQGYGLTPNPDEAYTLKYRYFKYSVPLLAHGDETDIPDQFRHVIVLGASKHMARMMDELPFSESIDDREFQKELNYMRTIMINDEEYVRDTRIKF